MRAKLNLTVRFLVFVVLISVSFHLCSFNATIVAQSFKKIRKTSVKPKPVRFSCLPDDIKLDDVVSYGINQKKNVTVAYKLKAIKAYCHKGKLIGRDKREVRFFRMECWGNPPADYEERTREQNERLDKLKKGYTVIVLGCNPLTP